MKAYEDEEAAVALEAQETNITAPEVQNDAEDRSRFSSVRRFWRGGSVWTRDREREATDGGESGNVGAIGNGGLGRREDDVEMMRWTYFARTRR